VRTSSSASDATYRRSAGVLFRAYAGEVVIAAPNGDFELLSGPGAEVWALLAAVRSEEEIVRALAANYRAPVRTVERDVRRLMGDLVRRGLIESVDDA